MPRLRPITRREGLLAAALLVPAGLVAACSGGDDATATATSDASGSTGGASTDVGGTLASEVAADEASLIAMYDAAIAAMPEGDDRLALLTAIRDQHSAHLDALAAEPAATDTTTMPSAADAVIPRLARAERQAARSRIRAAEEADPALARLLVFLAASESAHAAELREARP